VTHVHLATGLAVRDERGIRTVLLVASTYPNHSDPLWNLPGGRQRPGELLTETVVREFREETGLQAHVERLAYVSESYDGSAHFVNTTFEVSLENGHEPSLLPAGNGGDHVVAAAWIPLEEIASRVAVAVVRDPLTAYLRGDLAQRYAGFHQAGITIAWEDSP
jgi:ADP-ribose pyrophosphatase YjhB (NUDIX family)